jgi:hypothetical protein
MKDNWYTRMIQGPTPLEKAAKELGQLQHQKLEVTASIAWGQHRLAYMEEREKYLKGILAESATV